MTICQHCGKIGGYHYAGCAPPKFRTERCGGLLVYIAVKP